MLEQRAAFCHLRLGPHRSHRCHQDTSHPRFEGGPKTQKAERLPLLELYRAGLKSGRARTPHGGARGPCRRLLVLSQGGHLRLTGLGTCHHPPAERLARQEPPRAEEGPAGQECERPRPGRRPSPRRPMPARQSRETGGGSAGDTTRDAAAATELRRARPDSGDSPAGGRGPGLGVAMTEKRGRGR